MRAVEKCDVPIKLAELQANTEQAAADIERTEEALEKHSAIVPEIVSSLCSCEARVAVGNESDRKLRGTVSWANWEVRFRARNQRRRVDISDALYTCW